MVKAVVIIAGLAVGAPFAAAQKPTSAAEERFDVDGDGKLDVVRINDLSQLEVIITGNSRGQNPWKALSGEGKIVSGKITWGTGKKFGNHTVIVAEAGFRKGRRGPIETEAVAVRYDNGKLVDIWHGAVGAVGRDGEWSVALEATSYGLLRYRKVPGVIRCDNKTAYLAAERYDFRKGKFRAVSQSVRIDSGATVLTATTTPPANIRADVQPVAFRASAASTSLVPPQEIDDGDPKTAWVETKGGFGKGEFVTAQSWIGDQPVRVLRIVPGHAASASAFSSHNRVRRLGLLIGSEQYWLQIPVDPNGQGDADAPYWAELPEPVRASCVTAIVADVYPRASSKRNRGVTAIAELSILTELELSPDGADSALAQTVAGGGKHAARAAKLLASRGATGEQALMAEAKRAKSGETRRRIRLALARIPAGAEELAAGLADDSASKGDHTAYAGALAAIGVPGVTPLSAMLRASKSSDAAKRRAVATLQQIAHESARDALVSSAGTGSRLVRKHLATSLGHRAEAELSAIVNAATGARSNTARESDLWRAVGVMARNAKPGHERSKAAQAIADRLASAKKYELRYRLLSAGGSIDEAAALTAVGRSLESLRSSDDPNDVALRRVATAALDGNRSDDAAGLLAEATRDPDPGVRGRAVAALAGRPGKDDELIERLTSDRWAHVRRASAGALGARCARRPPRDALLAAAKTDGDDGVRITSLSALVECKAPGIGHVLVALATSRKQGLDVRAHAIRLIGQLGDKTLAPELIDLFSVFRKQAWSKESAIRLGATAATAMCKLGDPSVVRPLSAAAKDETFPLIQAASVSALACYCPKGSRRLFRRLESSSNRPVSIAAHGASERCKK